MRISDWSSDVCSSDLLTREQCRDKRGTVWNRSRNGPQMISGIGMECKVHTVGSEVSRELQCQRCRNIDVRQPLTDEERAVVSCGRHSEQFTRSLHEYWVVQRLRQHLPECDGSVLRARLGVAPVDRKSVV